MKNKIVGIVLFFCLLCPVIFTFTYLHFHKKSIRKHIKHQMMDNLSKETLVLFKFTQKESQKLKWKHAEEFSYRGEMYDVVDKKIHGDTLYYYCWWDHKETALNIQLKKALSGVLNKDDENREKQDWWLTWMKNILPESIVELRSPFYELTQKRSLYRERETNLFYSPSVPPPELC